jgi:hypothetical protein
MKRIPCFFQGYKLESNGSLLIESAEIRNAGIYVCIAQNTAGTALLQIRLEAQGNIKLVNMVYLIR